MEGEGGGGGKGRNSRLDPFSDSGAISRLGKYDQPCGGVDSFAESLAALEADWIMVASGFIGSFDGTGLPIRKENGYSPRQVLDD